jgi:Zn-dependent protease
MDTPSIVFIQHLAVWTIPVLYAITMHEAAHGYVAMLLGDKTAYMLGRVSLNPFKHVDPMGTVAIPLLLLFLGGFIFGWAKPVPVNEHSFKNPKRDMALVAMAGPLSNLIMALLWALAIKLSFFLRDAGYEESAILHAVGSAGVIANVVLGMFNLLPIPPLDGSRLLSSVLSRRLSFFYGKLESIGFIILLGLIVTGLLNDILGPLVSGCFELITSIVF